jgi:vancomycin resistance protein YoaR
MMFYDERIAQNYLQDIAAGLDGPMVEASLELEQAEVIVRNGQIGRKLDVDASLITLSDLLTAMQSGDVPLTVEETAPDILDASAQADLARTILSEPLVLMAPAGGVESGPWTISPADLADMLVISRVSNGEGEDPVYQVAINEDLLVGYLDSLAADLHVDPVNTRFMFNDDTGQLEVLETAVTGRNLNVQASVTYINDHLVAGEHQIDLQFDTLQPEVTDEMSGEELGITELVEEQWSYFWGSDPARVQNIEIAAAQFHGLLVAPGETFSMADALGNVSLENGYAEALIIYGDQTIQGVGGGVCQVSTTLFRTAFFAGFPIVERHAHAYRVGYYEQAAGGIKAPQMVGLDATVYVPIVDLKFVNDTDNWLLMETYVYPGSYSLLWKFYSTDDRDVEWQTTGLTNVVPAPEDLYRENPDLEKGVIKHVDYRVDGGDVTVNRTVYKDGKVYFADSFYTHFQPWQAIYEYGPGTEGIPEPDSE